MSHILSYTFLSLISIAFVRVNAQTEKLTACTTPINISGSCLPLRNCTSLFTLISKGVELTPADRQHLSDSQCGYSENQPLVCCPDLKSTKDVSDILPARCGIMVEDRIIRGIKADLDTFSWLALLEYSKPNNTKEVHCVGVLISKRYVLAAAHCLDGNNFPSTWELTGVRLGEHDLNSDIDCEQYLWGQDCNEPIVNVAISEKIIHENYDHQSKNRANDIALLRLQYEIDYTDFISPICLPEAPKLVNLNYDKVVLEDGGWYRDTNEYSVKLTGKIDIIGAVQCNNVYNQNGIFIKETQLCGKSWSSYYQSCKGLTGSPLMGKDSNNVMWYLAGLESFGSPMCREDRWPNVYTRISSYIDWIKSKIQH